MKVGCSEWPETAARGHGLHGLRDPSAFRLLPLIGAAIGAHGSLRSKDFGPKIESKALRTSCRRELLKEAHADLRVDELRKVLVAPM